MTKTSYIFFFFLILQIPSYAKAEQLINNIPSKLDIMAGQMVMIGFSGRSITKDHHIINDIKRLQIGGVVLFSSNNIKRNNIGTEKEIKKLTSDLQKISPTFKLLIAVDEEGGNVSRLKHLKKPPPNTSAHELGKINDSSKTLIEANKRALILKNLGFNLNLAPVVDIALNEKNKVIVESKRSFSQDPVIVTSHAARVIKGHKMEAVFTTLKHFPGHGSSLKDSHKGFVDVTNTWQKSELTPYLHLINDGFDEFIMTAHIFNANLDDKYPATLSKKILTDKLRGELKFKGVIISDDMQMGAIKNNYGFSESIELAINGGVDILLFANMIDSESDKHIAKKAVSVIKSLVLKGRISEDRIRQSFERIIELKNKYDGKVQL